jgi:hypothetical protein
MTNPSNGTSIESALAQLTELFGPPPVLPDSENAQAYQQMMYSFLECFQPQDFFETVLMKDLTDGTWEAARFVRHKVLLLHRRYRERRESEVNRRKEAAFKHAELAKRVAERKNQPLAEPEDVLDHLVEECDAILNEPATELDHNRVLEVTILYIEKLAKVEAQALAKRDKALEQLERYREGLGRSLRMVSDNFIDDQARTAAPSTDVSGTNAQSDANSEAAANPALVPAQ